jgi:hypothetical protein
MTVRSDGPGLKPGMSSDGHFDRSVLFEEAGIALSPAK